MKKLPNIHPGDILKEDFLEPLNMSAYQLAQKTDMPLPRIMDVLHKKRGITADTAMRLSCFFGNSPQFWLGLQNDYDIEEVKREKEKVFKKIIPWRFFDLAHA